MTTKSFPHNWSEQKQKLSVIDLHIQYMHKSATPAKARTSREPHGPWTILTVTQLPRICNHAMGNPQQQRAFMQQATIVHSQPAATIHKSRRPQVSEGSTQLPIPGDRTTGDHCTSHTTCKSTSPVQQRSAGQLTHPLNKEPESPDRSPDMGECRSRWHCIKGQMGNPHIHLMGDCGRGVITRYG